MKRRVFALVPLALAVSACAVGNPKPATYVTDISATLNGDAYSSIQGELRYWFRYGETTGYGTQTPVRTIPNEDTVAHPVSEPISGLSAETTYHWQMCVQDDEEDPPRDICSTDRTFTTGPAGGHSGIAYSHGGPFFGVVVMNADGSDPVNLSALTPGAEDARPAFSPDGRELAFQAATPRGGWQIFAMPVDGSNRRGLRPTTIRWRTIQSAWSPDGRKIAYTSSRRQRRDLRDGRRRGQPDQPDQQSGFRFVSGVVPGRQPDRVHLRS